MPRHRSKFRSDLMIEIMGKIHVDDNGCWLIDHPTLGDADYELYGTVSYLGESMGAHRAVWIALNGPITDGKWVLHHCDRPRCCNPEHLYLGTEKDNVADSIARGRRSWRRF